MQADDEIGVLRTATRARIGKRADRDRLVAAYLAVVERYVFEKRWLRTCTHEPGISRRS